MGGPTKNIQSTHGLEAQRRKKVNYEETPIHN